MNPLVTALVLVVSILIVLVVLGACVASGRANQFIETFERPPTDEERDEFIREISG